MGLDSVMDEEKRLAIRCGIEGTRSSPIDTFFEMRIGVVFCPN